VSTGDTKIEVPKNATAKEIDQVVNAIRRLEGKRILLKLE
jgi:hypothetical protein